MGNTNPNFGIQLGQNMATEAASGMLGIAMGAYNDRRQIKQQQRLQDQQIAGQKQMTDYNMQKQLEMWKATSYQAQVEQMNKAGINPALIYGMSGGGGQTADIKTGQVAGGEAPRGGHEIQDSIGMGMQLQLLQAQKRNIDADTANKLAENTNYPKTGANIEADTAAKQQSVNSAKAQQELTEVNTNIARVTQEIAEQTQNTAIATIQTSLREATEKLQILTNQKEISDATKNQQIEMYKTQLIGAGIQNLLMEQNIKASKAEIKKWTTELQQGWRSLDQKDTELAIRNFEAQVRANYPGLGATFGNIITSGLEQIKKAIGDNSDDMPIKPPKTR